VMLLLWGTDATATALRRSHPHHHPSCGAERWSQKILADAAVSTIDFENVVLTTVEKLSILPSHCAPREARGEGPQEFRVYQVEAEIIVAKRESDKDIHLGLKDLVTGDTMIAESVDPDCAKASPYYRCFIRVRGQIGAMLSGININSLVGKRVEVQGVGFYDKSHGQSAMASSCLELHPILSIQEVQ